MTRVASRLTNGGTYTFTQLEKLCGRHFADHARALASVSIGLTPAPQPRARAPRRAAGEVPARRDGRRLGDRLARS